MTERFLVVDLFSGCGGMSLGFEKAGFKIVASYDFWKPAIETYQRNFSHKTYLLELNELSKLESSTVIIGGPPCQGFSSAGQRKIDDERNTLVRVFALIIARYKPLAFVFENVEGFLTQDKGRFVFDLLEPLIEAGYRIHLRKINAAHYGVPQHRKRVLAIGGLGWDPTFPEHTHSALGAPGARLANSNHLPFTPTLIEAFKNLPIPTEEGGADQIPSDHTYIPYSKTDKMRASLLKPGQRMRDLPKELWHESYQKRAYRRVIDGTPTERRGGAPSGLRRLSALEPSKAITGGALRDFIHPTEDRPLTIRECARLQTFPDEFAFVGSQTDKMQMIGNAVPVLLAKRIAENLKKNLETAKPIKRKGSLLSFVPTLSSGMSPVLKEVCGKIEERFLSAKNHAMPLTKAQQTIWEKARSYGSGGQAVGLTDEICAYLVGRIIHDLDMKHEFPEIPENLPSFFDVKDLDSLILKNVDARSLFERLVSLCFDADMYFACLATLHKARLKYEKILETQPIPTLEQVGPRGLLQYGKLSPMALAGLLFWRKWFFDIDNRAGQETGYLFEPVIAHAVGGVPVPASKSPVKRRDKSNRGRQVDCLLGKQAYEFKIRVTIAASGQGRWGEELDFPVDCKESGYTPMLVVLDSTPNPKLAELENAFLEQGGTVYKGADAWEHLDELAGPTMSLFLEKYVRGPIDSIIEEAPLKLPKLVAEMLDGVISISVGSETLNITRQEAEVEAGQPDELPDDVGDSIPG
ncbi:DNA cytosine methyltransferase [Cyanobacteria bacterium FACHB-471]|nr:DNA cytosine methyltransferase [Cyanobacteria bacterium FACHB-471]